MATGEPVVKVIRALPPGTLYAQEDIRVGGSTPAESVPCWAFAAGSTEYMDFLCQLIGYDGGGLTFTLLWMAASATSGGVRWEVAARRLVDDAEDVDGSHSYDFNGVTATAPSASGEQSYDNVTFTHGADMDSWDEGEFAIVRVRRKHDDAGDDMAGDAQLMALVGKET